jgi:hypothetical protein
VRLHYGCGLDEASGWANFDASPTLWSQRLPLVGPVFHKWMPPLFPAGVQYGDIIRGLPLPAAPREAIYCCHVLEHLALEDLSAGPAKHEQLPQDRWDLSLGCA